MSRKDGVLALLVVVVWGLNFVVIKVGLHNMPPLMLAGLRFMLVAFPAIFFVARPKVPLNLRHCCKVSDEAAFCLIQRPYISKTLLTRRISPRGSP